MIIDTNRVNALKGSLNLRNTCWKPQDSMEWAWNLYQAIQKLKNEFNGENGLDLASLTFSGMCQFNNMLKFDGFINECIDSVMTNFDGPTPPAEVSLKGVLISSEPIVYGGLLQGSLPQMVMAGVAGVGCAAFIMEK